MQEEIENRTINLVISTSKLTSRALIDGMRGYLNHTRSEKSRKAALQTDARVRGRQSVNELIGQNQGVSTIDIKKTEIKGFERVARKYGIDYAVRKDKSEEKPKYLIFFKARDRDAVQAAYTEYASAVLGKKKAGRPSVLKTLRKFREKAAERNTHRTREKVKEKAR